MIWYIAFFTFGYFFDDIYKFGKKRVLKRLGKGSSERKMLKD